MPQDAPADTAGPSSPPPPLPEGWLPQWEGVQRKWYYVQRATGKSQWEIPTEPVVLTPSTTPTSIGTGPSQPPRSRQATHTPQAVERGKNVVEGNYDVVDRARTASSMGSQAHGQSENSAHEYTGVRDWLSSQAGQRPGSSHRQHSISGRGSHREPQLNDIHPPTFYQGHPYALGQAISGQCLHAQPWTDRTDAEVTHQGGFSVEKIQQPHQEPMRPVLSHDSLPPYPWVATLPRATAGTGTDNAMPRSSWRPDQQFQFPHVASHHGQMDVSPPDTSQLFFGSHPAPRDTRNTFQNLSSRAINSSTAASDSEFKRNESQPALGPIHAHSSLGMAGQAQSWLGYPLLRSHSEQNIFTQQLPFTSNHTGTPFSHGPPSQPDPQRYPQASEMTHMPPRADNSGRAVPICQSQGSFGSYQNPLVQAGVNQYLPPQNQANRSDGGPTHPEQAQYYQTHQDLASQSRGRYGARVSNPEPSRAAVLDPQFVSGPWASSASSSATDKPFRYN